MKIAPFVLIAAGPLLAACGSTGDPWVSYRSFAAAAAPSASTLLATHFDMAADCTPGPAPEILIEQNGALGGLSATPTTETIVDPEGECDGAEIPATAVYYDAGAQVGDDVAIYRELRTGPVPDRIHTAHIRVR